MDQHIQTRQNSDDWIAQIFAAGAARKGGVVRRSIDWVAREVGIERLELEVRRRGYHMVAGGGQFVIFCSREPVRMIC